MKTKCTPCGRFFPEHLINPLFTGGKGYEEMCPICALESMNKTHGMNRTQFNGTMANEWLAEARAYLKSRE